jgi:hypothetical protein
MSRELPAVGTSKARLLAFVVEIHRAIEALPEGACRVLEEARVLHGVNRNIGQLGHAAELLQPASDAVKAVTRAWKALDGMLANAVQPPAAPGIRRARPRARTTR